MQVGSSPDIICITLSLHPFPFLTPTLADTMLAGKVYLDCLSPFLSVVPPQRHPLERAVLCHLPLHNTGPQGRSLLRRLWVRVAYLIATLISTPPQWLSWHCHARGASATLWLSPLLPTPTPLPPSGPGKAASQQPAALAYRPTAPPDLFGGEDLRIVQATPVHVWACLAFRKATPGSIHSPLPPSYIDLSLTHLACCARQGKRLNSGPLLPGHSPANEVLL
eukprot:GGOE01061153.1.p1 GENE.GGOE01061153.1~~GGOE01061153.1.p1  ORF type:complete len:222 (-),score=7.51 GGOE01061153.1:23-688(-)